MFRGEDLSGRVFGRLTAQQFAGYSTKGAALWRCLCTCGREQIIRGFNLTSGNTKSCGCLYRETVKTTNIIHGASRTSLYGIWCTMMTRCYKPKSRGYFRYGGRGISVCARWHDFINFAKDMGPHTPGFTLERKNNDGPYSLDNCRWATPKEQSRNTRRNIMVEYKGNKLCLIDLCKQLNIPYARTLFRLKTGWALEDAISKPVYTRRAA